MSVASSAALGLLEERTLENFLNAGKDHIRQVFVPLGSGETLKERGGYASQLSIPLLFTEKYRGRRSTDWSSHCRENASVFTPSDSNCAECTCVPHY